MVVLFLLRLGESLQVGRIPSFDLNTSAVSLIAGYLPREGDYASRAAARDPKFRH